MKITFFNEGIYAYASGAPSAIGGAERQQWLLSRALSRKGWSISVGVRDALEPGERITIGGVEFIGADRCHLLTALHKLLSSDPPHWFYWRGADHLWGPIVEIAKLSNVRTIFSAAFDTDVHPRCALARRARWWPLYAWGLARTDRIIVQHGEQLSALAPQWRSKASIVPSITGMAQTAKPHFHRARQVAWVGMLRQPKRPDLLIEIAQQLPTIGFVVCGSPTTHRSPAGYGDRVVDELLKLPNVQYLGQVDPDKAQQVIADAALLLSTSDGEGFPNTFLQAWSSGTPVISLKIDPERVIERLGLGARSGSLEQAITDINTLIDSPQLREEIARRARRHVDEAHSEAAAIAALESAIGSNGS